MSYTETVGLNIIATGTFNNLLSEVNKFKSELKALKLPNDVTKKLEGSFDKLNVEAEKFKNILNKGITTKGDFSKLMSSAKGVEAAMKVIKTEVASISNKQIRLSIQNLPEIKQLEGELRNLLNLQKQFKNFGTSKGVGAASAKEVVQIEQLISKMQKAQGIESAFRKVGRSFATGNIDKMTQSITRLVAEVDQYKLKMANVQGATANTGAIISWANSLQQNLNKTVSEADRLKNSINQLQANKFNQMKGSIDGISSGLNTATNNMRNFVSSQTQAASKTSQLNEQVGLLRTQANYFFGLQNIGRLISRGIREAAESVRDLDKAMTETAVVTPYTVTEMWDMLPEYTALANKLGATTQGAYETMTLYFQQGLNKEQTFQIGEETMKMARIAGLDYAQTTNMMTAALRGFNMELNNVSAQRVNDVYSKLAAITASDTRELGLAMERTASIANSAGMDFGNTTAFLAQMIETTREAPENLGTAMKTIVARFQELKQNPYEIGEVEGEEVDFNRVDKALKTIGVDLMDNKDKFRDLDEVFLEISEKWDGLSQTQQRYIATIAAGARQQSRFIAMVQNYDRLKELTEAAANSEGAADIQFGKTLDSYEAKVNKLKNAWQTFTMGLADNKVIKGGIGILEKIITLADKIIDLFGRAGKAVGGDFGKSIAQMAAAFGMAAMGFRGLYGGAVAGLGMLDRMAAKRAAGEAGILSSGAGAAKGMSVVTREERAAVMQKRKELYQMMSKGGKGGVPLFNTKDFQQQIKNLSADQQKALYSTSPGLRQALQKSWGNAYKGMNLTKETNAAVKNQIKTIDGQIKNGETTVQKALARTMNPYQVGKDIGGATGREIMTAIDKEITKMSAKESAHHDAFKKMKQDYGHQASKLVAQGKLKSSDAKEWVQERLRADTGKMMQEENLAKTPVAINKATAAMSAFSGATMKGGQAMMGLGMAMSAAGFPAFGGIVMTAGTGIMGLGMAAEGAAAGISKIGAAIMALKASNPELLAISAVMAAVTAGLVAIKVIRSKAEKEARETGDKIVDSYTQATKKSKKELDEFKSYQEKWSEWTAGVDANGNNVGLEASEYQEYLKAVKNITKAHPELIKGYNALGNAIIDNNTALKDAIILTQKDEKNALNEYLNSYDAIVAKQKTYKSWQKANGTKGQGEQAKSNAVRAGAKGSVGGQNAKTMEDEANAVVESINKIEGGAEVLKDYGIEVNEAGELTERGLENLRTHLGDVTNAVKALDLSPDEKGQKALDKMTESADTYAKTVQNLEKVSQDSYDWGWTYATKQGYDKIESGLVVPFQTAIERAAEKGLTQTEFQNEIDAIGQKYQNLGGHLRDFQQIQKEVENAQKALGESADFDAYTDTVEVATAEMDGWIAELKSSTEEADHILAEWLENEKTIMLDYSQRAAQDLSEGLNQDQALFASSANASKRYESMKEQITDYASGLNSMKAILDDAMTDQNLEGGGSLTFEQASKSILGEDFVKNNADDIDKVKAQMKEYQGWLQDSEGNVRSLEDTYTSFWDHIVQAAMKSPDKTIEGIDGKLSDFFVKTEEGFIMNADKWSSLTDEQMGFLAEQGFNMSADFMSSMLNIGRQLGYYSSANIDMVKQGLIEQNGQGSAVGEDSTVYKRRSDLEEESRAAMNSEAETQKILEEAEKAGIELIDEVSKMSGESIKTMMDNLGVSGEKSGESFGRNFIEKFEGLNYNKDEVSQAIDTAIASRDFTDEEKASLQEAQANLNNIWDDILEKKDLGLEEDKSAEETTAQAAQSIDSKLGQMLAEEGKLSKDAYTDAEGNGLGYGALQTVLGGKGKDTLAQVFASGTDLAGNKLTDEQFKTQLSQLQNLRKYYAEQEALMRTNAENTSGDDKKWWTDQADYAQQAIGYLDTYIQKGQEAHQEKIQQNEDENASNDQKTDKIIDNNQKEIESEQQKNDKKTPETEAETGTESSQTEQLEQLQAKFDDLKSQEPVDLNSLFGLNDQNAFNESALQFSNLLNDLNLSQEQMTSLSSALQNLNPGELQNLSNVQLSGLLSQLNLTEEQLQVVDTLDPNIKITSEADTTEADTAVQNVEEETAEPKILKVVAEAVGGVSQVAKQAVDQAKQQPQQQTQQQTTVNNVTLQTAITNPDEPKQKIDEAMPKNYKTTVNASITMNSTVNPGNTQKQLQAAQPKKGTTVTNTVKTEAKTTGESKVTSLASVIKNLKNKAINIAAKVSGDSKVNSLKSTINALPTSKTVTINVKKNGNVPQLAEGHNNYISHRPPIHANSLANGATKRREKNSFRGGLTLTGEEGFEIAWIPSQNRSMILGANGPQMVDLPKDVVVWNNEQSKKIVKQKAIPAKSMRSGGGPTSSPSLPSSSSSSSSSTSKTVSNTAKHVKDNSDKAAKAITDASKGVGYVCVWWDNIARKTEVTQRRMDDSSKAFEKYLKEMSATLRKTGQSLESGGGGGDKYIKNITDYISYNKAQVKRAKSELKVLDKGTKAQRKAAKTKTKKDNKKANRKAYNTGAASATKISYSTGKGKKKKTKEEIVSLSPYIKAQNGTYVIDQKKINKIKNVEKRRAIADAANKEINDRLSKKYTAEDNIEKAREALEKMGEELYKTFFAWENELTKIWNLTKQIEATETRVSRAKEYQELLNKQLSSGMAKSNKNFNKETLNAFKIGVAQSAEKIKEQAGLLEEQRKAVLKAISTEDEKATLAAIQKKLNDTNAVDNAASNLSSKQAALSSAKNKKAQAKADKKNAAAQIKSLKAQKAKAKGDKKKTIQKKIDAAEKKKTNAEKVLKTIDATITNYQNQVNQAQKTYNAAVAAASVHLNDTEKLGYETYAKELQNKIDAQTAAQKYLKVNQKYDGTVDVTFDTNAFEADKLKGLFTEERGKAIQDYVKGIQESSDELNKTYQSMTSEVADMYSQLETLENNWADYADELWDISESEIKKETENIKKLSDSISKALKNLLDEIKRKLDERRKQEDNAQKEAEISKKQQRLAALQADTAGGHQVEIAQLQKEIADAQQDYQRSLEDQLLEKLQQQADVAEQQRERQIELQEAISEGVNNASLVDLWMSNPDLYRNEIYEAYKTANDYDKKPKALQDQLDRKFEELMNGLSVNQLEQKEVVDAITNLETIIDQISKTLKLMTLDIFNAKKSGYSVKEAKDLLGVSYSELRTKGGYTVEDFANAGVEYSQARTAFSAEELKNNQQYKADANKEIAKKALDDAWNAWNYKNVSSQTAFEQAKNKAQEAGIVDFSKYDIEAKRRAQQQADADAEAARQAQIAREREAAERARAEQQRKAAELTNAKSNYTATKDKKNIALLSSGTTADSYYNFLLKRGNKYNVGDSNWGKLGKDGLQAQIDRGAKLGYSELKVLNDLADTEKLTWTHVLKAYKDLKGKTTAAKNLISYWGSSPSNPRKTGWKAVFGKNYPSYKTGGLANYTGPAWLDGTPSKPELVLNAADTQNFLALKDVLSKAVNSSNSVSNSYGDATYEININVDHINNDYDVDRMAERVKKIIVKDAGYRNVTQVRNFR